MSIGSPCALRARSAGSATASCVARRWRSVSSSAPALNRPHRTVSSLRQHQRVAGGSRSPGGSPPNGCAWEVITRSGAALPDRRSQLSPVRTSAPTPLDDDCSRQWRRHGRGCSTPGAAVRAMAPRLLLLCLLLKSSWLTAEQAVSRAPPARRIARGARPAVAMSLSESGGFSEGRECHQAGMARSGRRV